VGLNGISRIYTEATQSTIKQQHGITPVEQFAECGEIYPGDNCERLLASGFWLQDVDLYIGCSLNRYVAGPNNRTCNQQLAASGSFSQLPAQSSQP